MKWLLALLISSAFAQAQPQERDELFWCQQQRNFGFDSAAKNAAAAAKLQDEVEKLKTRIKELEEKK